MLLLDDDNGGDDDSKSTTGIIIGVTLGVAFAVILIITTMCIIKKKIKKTSPQRLTLSTSLQTPMNNSSQHNTRYTEVLDGSTSRETTFTTFTLDASKPPYSRSCQPPANVLSDDVPSYPPPDYASASKYPSWPTDDPPLPDDDVPPPDYACVVSSDHVSTTL